MAKIRFSLFTKIIVWFFLNLLIVGAIVFVFFTYEFRPNRLSSNHLGNNIEALKSEATESLNDKTRPERDAILKTYTEKYSGVKFYIFDRQGNQLGGEKINLPPEVLNQITAPEADRPPLPPEAFQINQPEIRRKPPPPPGAFPPPPPSNYLQTTNPTLYWFVGKSMLYENNDNQPIRIRFVAASDSFYGYGLYFNPLPWLLLIGTIVGVSILFWFPFVRNITKTVGQITTATEKIAEEDFAVRVGEKRTDELGRLGASINHLAERLSGFVHGQKRFLGDISHELNSPLARMNFALTILEDRVDAKNRAYVEDVKEEVELMSKLVSELLAYSKAGIKTAAAECRMIELKPLVELAVARETGMEKAAVNIEIAEGLEVSGQSEMIVRAVSNIVRNAIRYAGAAGAIRVTAEKTENDQVEIVIADNGAGVPENALDKIFDPLYRVESDRSRQSGGSGLGLAIVKTCVEACGGKVFAENRQPHGLAVKIHLQSV